MDVLSIGRATLICEIDENEQYSQTYGCDPGHKYPEIWEKIASWKSTFAIQDLVQEAY